MEVWGNEKKTSKESWEWGEYVRDSTRIEELKIKKKSIRFEQIILYQASPVG